MRPLASCTLSAVFAGVISVSGTLAQSGPSSTAPGTGSGTHDTQVGNPPMLERGGTATPDAAPSGPSLGNEAPRALTDPQPAPAPESAASEARIRAMLEAQGYSDVQNIRKEGEGYTATALRDGQSVNLRLDPQLGQIQEHGG